MEYDYSIDDAIIQCLAKDGKLGYRELKCKAEERLNRENKPISPEAYKVHRSRLLRKGIIEHKQQPNGLKAPYWLSRQALAEFRIGVLASQGELTEVRRKWYHLILLQDATRLGFSEGFSASEILDSISSKGFGIKGGHELTRKELNSFMHSLESAKLIKPIGQSDGETRYILANGDLRDFLKEIGRAYMFQAANIGIRVQAGMRIKSLMPHLKEFYGEYQKEELLDDFLSMKPKSFKTDQERRKFYARKRKLVKHLEEKVKRYLVRIIRKHSDTVMEYAVSLDMLEKLFSGFRFEEAVLDIIERSKEQGIPDN